MFIQRRIDTRSVPPDENFVREDTGPIRQISTGNQLLLNRVGRGAYRNSVTVIAPDDVAIDYGTAIESIGEWIGINIGSEHTPQEVHDVKKVVIDASSFAHFEPALRIVNTGSIGMPNATTFVLATARINRLTTQARIDAIQVHIDAILHTWLEDSEQTKMQNVANEIKDWYADHIGEIIEVQRVFFKQDQGEIRFLVTLDDMRRDLSDQLGEIEDQLEDNYTNWIFDFKYMGTRASYQQIEKTYVELYTRD